MKANSKKDLAAQPPRQAAEKKENHCLSKIERVTVATDFSLLEADNEPLPEELADCLSRETVRAERSEVEQALPERDGRSRGSGEKDGRWARQSRAAGPMKPEEREYRRASRAQLSAELASRSLTRGKAAERQPLKFFPSETQTVDLHQILDAETLDDIELMLTSAPPDVAAHPTDPELDAETLRHLQNPLRWSDSLGPEFEEKTAVLARSRREPTLQEQRQPPRVAQEVAEERERAARAASSSTVNGRGQGARAANQATARTRDVLSSPRNQEEGSRFSALDEIASDEWFPERPLFSSTEDVAAGRPAVRQSATTESVLQVSSGELSFEESASAVNVASEATVRVPDKPPFTALQQLSSGMWSPEKSP
jgi:hypothetical protein